MRKGKKVTDQLWSVLSAARARLLSNSNNEPQGK
jgi:hypothetical protein